MDDGPFRVSRPVDRRAVNRPEPAFRPPEQPQPVAEEPKTVHRASTSHQSKKEKKSPKRSLIIGVVIATLILAILGFLAFSNAKNGGIAIDSSKYQAVFFTNGQVYFGKLSKVNDEYLKLTDVFYLQTQSADAASSENPQETSTDQSNVQLIKLGEEIHGPEDQMVLSKDQVLFYENLKSDGKVVQSIESYKKTD